jgi:hypothetical protein
MRLLCHGTSLQAQGLQSPTPAQDVAHQRESFGRAQFVRIKVRRLGSEVAMVGEMVRIGLVERRTCWRRRRRGKLEREVMLLSVRSSESSESRVTPRFSMAGILCPVAL